MHYLRELYDGMTRAPFRNILEMLEMPPDRWWPGFSMLIAIIAMCELVRIALGTVFTRSRVAHLVVCLFTFAFQALLISVVLVLATRAHPERGWINVGLGAALYVIWFLVGESTKIVRPDSEGADLGFMSVGALITLSTGVVAALVC